MPLTLLAYGDSAERWKSILEGQFSDLEVIALSEWGAELEAFNRVSGLIGWKFPSRLLKSLPNLQWIQLISVGAEEWVQHPLIGPEVIITNTKGLYADSVAEYVLWAILTLRRKFHVVMKNQTRRRWKHVYGSGLKGKVLGILGMGNIGQAIAMRAKSFGMQIIGITREPHSEFDRTLVDESRSAKELHDVIGRVDVLVLCLPLTEETQGLINERLLSHMKADAIIINAARAGLLNETLLAQALKQGNIAGAALDVFETEPMSRWSRLWGVENLLVSPHLAALTQDYGERVSDLICANIHLFQSQQPLLNIVDRTKGY